MFKPMLAQPFQMKYLKNEYALQYKYDGIRCVYNDGKFWTRTGKPILSMPELLKELPHMGDLILDGELYCHGKSLQKIVSSVRKTVNIDEDKSVQYIVYDCYHNNMFRDISFEKRWNGLVHWYNNHLNSKRIKIAETVFRSGSPESALQLDIGSPLGYEGTIARNADAPYTPGKRSYDLLKIKPVCDNEFLVVGITQLNSYEKIIVPIATPGSKQYADGRFYKNGEAHPENMMGSLVCQTKAGIRFEIGTGFDDATRDLFWHNPPIGKMATIKYAYLTDDGIPFHPVFIAVRDYE